MQDLWKKLDVMPVKDTDTLELVKILSLEGVPITNMTLKIRKTNK